MRDIHCHILPGVDDGAADIDESLAMLEAARAAGVTGIVCTPHCRDPYFDFDAMWDAYRELKARAGDFPLQMGFEVAHAKLMELGMQWAPRLCFEGSDEFLLELDPTATEVEFRQYERTVYDLQRQGMRVIVAHPERYRLVQRCPQVAADLVRMGCRLQASADFMRGGRFGREKRPALRLFKRGLYTDIASDAHCAEHYALLAKALKRYPVRGTQ